jgi:hypothetical protein
MCARDYPARSRLRGSQRTTIASQSTSKPFARRLGDTPEMLFGRLCYYLDYKYRYEQSNGAEVHLFALKVGEKEARNPFPYVVSVLAAAQRCKVPHEVARSLWV